MTGLMQTLRVHDLLLMEQGNNLIIHKNKAVNQISSVYFDGVPVISHRRHTGDRYASLQIEYNWMWKKPQT